jgi:hypothetical protein
MRSRIVNKEQNRIALVNEGRAGIHQRPGSLWIRSLAFILNEAGDAWLIADARRTRTLRNGGSWRERDVK